MINRLEAQRDDSLSRFQISLKSISISIDDETYL